MQLTTPILIPKQPLISYQSQLLMLGSCFAQHMGNRFSVLRFNGQMNPFGIMYNPLSIAAGLERIVQNKPFEADELFEYNHMWHSWMHHGSFSNTDKTLALQQINTSYQLAVDNLPKTDCLIITFGSSWIYQYQGNVVNNCHKLPSKAFVQERLSVDSIVEIYTHLLPELKAQNESLQVILSVSPVRYMGIEASYNATNKAILLLATEKLCQLFDYVHYFPAYELVLDELRDYRFYADDMIHPSDLAAQYVWERFMDSYFTDETKRIIPQVVKINQALTHRPLHPESDAYHKFKTMLKVQIEEVQLKYPFLRLDNLDIDK